MRSGVEKGEDDPISTRRFFAKRSAGNYTRAKKKGREIDVGQDFLDGIASTCAKRPIPEGA